MTTVTFPKLEERIKRVLADLVNIDENDKTWIFEFALMACTLQREITADDFEITTTAHDYVIRAIYPPDVSFNYKALHKFQNRNYIMFGDLVFYQYGGKSILEVICNMTLGECIIDTQTVKWTIDVGIVGPTGSRGPIFSTSKGATLERYAPSIPVEVKQLMPVLGAKKIIDAQPESLDLVWLIKFANYARMCTENLRYESYEIQKGSQSYHIFVSFSADTYFSWSLLVHFATINIFLFEDFVLHYDSVKKHMVVEVIMRKSEYQLRDMEVDIAAVVHRRRIKSHRNLLNVNINGNKKSL